MIGDWNNEPDKLAAHPWLQWVKGKIVVPGDSVITCLSAEAGSLIDYAVAPPGLASKIEMRTEPVPWKPHLGLSLSIKGKIARPQVRVQAIPWAPKLKPEEKGHRYG